MFDPINEPLGPYRGCANCDDAWERTRAAERLADSAREDRDNLRRRYHWLQAREGTIGLLAAAAFGLVAGAVFLVLSSGSSTATKAPVCTAYVEVIHMDAHQHEARLCPGGHITAEPTGVGYVLVECGCEP